VLSTQNLISKVPGAGGGSFVQPVDHRVTGQRCHGIVRQLAHPGQHNFDEVADVRQFLEVPSVRLAATNRTDAEIRQLGEIVERQKNASVDDPNIPEWDRQFHTLIGQASGNRVLASFVAGAAHATEPVHYLDLSPEVGRETVRQHQAIARAIAARDPDSAEAAIVEHLTYLRHHISAHPTRMRSEPRRVRPSRPRRPAAVRTIHLLDEGLLHTVGDRRRRTGCT